MVGSGPLSDVVAASPHVPGPLEGRIFGTLFVMVCVVVVVGYCIYEVYSRRWRRRQDPHLTDEDEATRPQ